MNKYRFHLLGLAHTKTTKEYSHCFSSDTDILTEIGWMKLSYLVERQPRIKVATLNLQTDTVEYHFPLDIVKREHNGDMIHLKAKSVDSLITPEHMSLVRTIGERRNGTHYTLARIDNDSRTLCFRRDFPWQCTIVPPQYLTIPAYDSPKCHKPEKQVSFSSWVKFLAIYLAEGALTYGDYTRGDNTRVSKPYSVSIAQVEGAKKEKIKSLISGLNFDVTNRMGKDLLINDIQLGSYIESLGLGKCKDKFIPFEYKQLPVGYLEDIINWLVLGDGTEYPTIKRLVTSSENLMNDTSEIALKAGYTVTVGTHMSTGWIVNMSMNERRNMSEPILRSDQRAKQHYEGMVYCITVPNHIIYVRRNGKSYWSGNCAYTQKIFKMGKMLTDLGHEVYHYGAEGSTLQCTEHITCVTDAEQSYAYEDRNWPSVFFDFKSDDFAYKKLNERAIQEINKRKKPKDILLCSMGRAQQEIAQKTGVLAVEMGIGYTGVFANYRVFESYAWMSYVYGLYYKNMSGCDGKFYDAVIPNYFDPEDFEFADRKHDYILYIGRVTARKGIQIAIEVAHRLGIKLVVAGQKTSEKLLGDEDGLVEYVGPVGVKERSDLMKNARAILVPTIYLEPFGGVNVEAMFCGTPAVTSDWGGFAETVQHGKTGYRCRTIEQFTWAVEHGVDKLDPAYIRDYAINNYSMDRIGLMYQEYFDQIHTLWGKGFYEVNPNRTNLDWLSKWI